MEIFHYDLIYPDKGEMEINALFAENVDVAVDFFDRLFLELHQEREHLPAQIRLRHPDSDDALATYDMHADALGQS